MKKDGQDGNSVGIVETRTVKLDLPEGGLRLKRGGLLKEIEVAYESYGELSEKKDNVVYICHALTGDAHVAGFHSADSRTPGWWEEMVGPGKGIDTNYYHVVCANILGGCKGTTGPSSINPDTGKPYGSTFPGITITDMVLVQKMFLEKIGIRHLAAVIGGSLGGMQVLEWSIRYPEMVDRCICVASGVSLSAQALAFDIVGREAILSDPCWAGGDYYDKERRPDWGLAHARKIGHITYLSPEMMQHKFGRQKRKVGEDSGRTVHRFEVDSYLDHQGDKFIKRFDANSYLQISQAMDSYDLVDEFESLEKAFSNIRSKYLVIALSSDWLFPPEQSMRLADALLRAGKEVSCCTLKAPHGHDAFLVDIEYLAEAVRAFLPWVAPEKSSTVRTPEEKAAFEDTHRRIIEMIRPESTVIDLGCGDGSLLSLLESRKQVKGCGIDIDLGRVIEAINKGHNVFQGDLDKGLSIVPDGAFDYAVLSSTLQVVGKPRFVLAEMLRVAKEGIVAFPNCGDLNGRLRLAFTGRMPECGRLRDLRDMRTAHLTTLNDFFALCREEGVEILETRYIPESAVGRLLVSAGMGSLGAGRALVRVRRAK